MRDDEAAAIPVLEAIMVALLVLTAILFISNVQRPLSGSETGGVDLGRLSSQTLALLGRQNITDGDGRPRPMEEWVTDAIQGNATTTALVDDYISRVLPEGANYALYLSNGVGSLRLLPTVDPGLPRQARAAEFPVFPIWGAFLSKANATVNATAGAPGQEVKPAGHPVLASFADPASAIACIRAPDGSPTGPGGVAWTTLWRQDPGRIPAGAPYGIWAGYTAADCATGPVYARVMLEDGTRIDYPLYGVRLVVWFGA